MSGKRIFAGSRQSIQGFFLGPGFFLWLVLCWVALFARQDPPEGGWDDFAAASRASGGAVVPQTATAPQASPEEITEFERLASETDPAARKRLIDEFVAKHPSSVLLGQVYQIGAFGAKQANDPAMMFQFGEKSLAVWPDNFVLMTELADGYVRASESDKAEPLALRALELLAVASKPPSIGDEEWVRGRKLLMGTNFTTLGFAHLRRAQGSKDRVQRWRSASRAVAPFKRAVEHQPKEDYIWYGLGYAQALSNDYGGAEGALARAVVLGGPVAADARKLLEDIYKGQNKSLEGLDQVLAKARGEMGVP